MQQLDKLSALASLRDEQSNTLRHALLKNFNTSEIPKSNAITQYFECLLYLLAYPTNPSERTLVEKEIHRLTKHVRTNRQVLSTQLQNSGLPYGLITAQFSHDAIRWMHQHPDYLIEIDSFTEARLQLHEVCYMTLPSVEKHIASTGMENIDLMDSLLVPKKDQLAFILNEFSQFDDQPQLKDTLFDQLGLSVTVKARGSGASKASNKLPINQVFYHEELLKRFDHQQLLFSPVPKPQKVTKAEKSQAIQVVKNTMLLTARETDPATYLLSDSFRLYALERGISIALYGMEASRQLPLESYVGYTVFKNGLPVSYGGAWVFGERANFGINVFDTFRKGESGYIMNQLLRLYRSIFNITYFEVEAYQFGLDNPEGIESGAFWFYYKYGFRPVEKLLRKKAKHEAEKIKKKRSYRTSQKTLIEFTDSNMCLQLGKRVPTSVPSITSKITRMIHRSFKGNRTEAVRECIGQFKAQTGLKRIPTSASFALSEVALWAKAFKIEDESKLNLMAKMVSSKSKDLYHYQELLLNFFSK